MATQPHPLPLGDVPVPRESRRGQRPLHRGAGGGLLRPAEKRRAVPSPALLPERVHRIAAANTCLESLRNGVLRTMDYVCKHNWRGFHISGGQGRAVCSEGMDETWHRGIPHCLCLCGCFQGVRSPTALPCPPAARLQRLWDTGCHRLLGCHRLFGSFWAAWLGNS